MKNKVTSITLMPEAVKILEELQKSQNRSMANIINVALKYYYEYLKIRQEIRNYDQ